MQHTVSVDGPLPPDAPFATALPTTITSPIGCYVKSDVYVDDTTTVSLEGSDTLEQA